MTQQSSTQNERSRLGGWLPSNEETLAAFREDLARRARERARTAPPTSVVQELAALLKDDAVLRMNATRAIDEALEAGFRLGYTGIDELIVVIGYLMTYAPPFSETSLIHCLLNALLDWPMCMPSGYALFRDPTLNAHLKRVLSMWCGFLSGPYSRVHLHTGAPDGWFSPRAREKIGLDQFLCNPDELHWDFPSWNASMLPGSRPHSHGPSGDHRSLQLCATRTIVPSPLSRAGKSARAAIGSARLIAHNFVR